MTSRNEHRANKRAGLVYVAGWIKADDMVKWSDMTKAAPWVLTDQERKAIATAIRTLGEPQFKNCKRIAI